MKKLNYFLALFGLIAAVQSVQAQNTFFENFNGGNALSNWTLIDVDGRTPNTNVAYVNDAWVVREDFDTTGVGDSAAVSNSWYTPAGAANDYMITPMIVTGATPVLEFDAKAQDPNFPDGYELLISTTTPDVAGLSTTLFSTTAENAAWTRRSINLSAYANDTIYIGWRNNSNDQFLLLIDNVKVYDAASDDASLASITVPSVVANASSTAITGTVSNSGVNTLTSVVVNWSVNNGPVNMDTLSVNIATGNSSTFSHQVSWTPSNAGNFSNLRVWTSLPNGVADGNTANDTASADIFVNLGNTVSKTALFEEFTTAVCQFCPDGAWVQEQMETNYANVATVNVHSCFSTDAMTNTEASTLCSTLGVNAAPTGMVDRKLFDGESDVAFGRGAGYPNWTASTWAIRSLAQANAGSPVDVNLGGVYNPTNRNMTVNVTASFVDYVQPGGNLSISLMIVEDSVIGSGSGYDQVNAYNTQTGHPYAGSGNPITNYPHRRVMRDILPSTFGDVTVIPSSYALNTPYTRTFNFTLNNSWDASHVSLIGIVSKEGGTDISQYEIFNVNRAKLGIATSIEGQENQLENSLNIYPNPSDLPFTNVEFFMENSANVQARITDVTGKVVSIEDFGTLTQGNQRIQLNTQDLENGFYFVNLKVGEYEVSRKTSILK